MPFTIVRNDITRMQVDAIVNAANPQPCFGAGVDSAIHKKAGPQLLEARKEIGYIQPGCAAITPAFNLTARFVIHGVSPMWEDGKQHELETLRCTYDACLNLAVENGCESVAFPLLASGNNGFPQSKALQVAIGAFSEFLLEHDLQIYLVVFSSESVRLSSILVHNVQAYIDENYVIDYEKAIYGGSVDPRHRERYQRRRRLEMLEERMAMPCAPVPDKSISPNLDDYIKRKDAGFTKTLLDLIQKKELKNSTVYKKANISKQHFSKLINDPDAKPSKQTAIALALALELDLNGTQDLIGRAGYTLSNSSTFDLIIRYFIEQRQYNVVEINIALYEFDQSLLGS